MNITFRKAVIWDVMTFFRIANDSSVRAQSFNSSKIKLTEHIRWYYSNLFRKDNIFLMIQAGDIVVGRIRLVNLKAREWIISYAISAEYRGKGYGKEVIRCIILYGEKQQIGNTLIGEVKKDNIPSVKCFENNGFARMELDDRYVFTYQINGG